MKRTVLWILGVLVALVLVVHVAGGWYFSSQINSDALAVHHDAEDYTLAVTAATTSSISLRETDGEEQPLHEGWTYGLIWPGGYGQVSGPVVETGGTVTRRFMLLWGRPPEVGSRVALDRDSFPESDPQVAVPGHPVRNVTYTSPGGRFPAWFVPGRRTTWVVLTHGGLGAVRAEDLRVMTTTVALGYPSLAIAYRNDPGCPADPQHRWTYGQDEWPDLQGAVRYALDHGAHDVVLVGYSMGGAITASFLEHSPLADRVSRVVLDSPMLDFQDTVEYAAQQQDLPLVGGVPSTITWSAERLASLRYDVDWSAVDYLDDDAAWLSVPTLVYQGDEDTRVPPQDARALADDHPNLVTLVQVPQARHVEAWNVDPPAYDNELRDFLTR